jgi:hypothetical protein
MLSSSSSRAGAGTSIEMVDLRQKRVKKPQGEFVMREFQPAGKVNQSQKKREKRKKQKAEAEAQARAELMAAQKS